MEIHRVQTDLAGRELVIETGKLAKQAHGAVTVQAGGTMVLVTVVASEQPREGIDFFPLTVDYEERMYAAGKIPGSFFKREGRPGERAILTCRMIDRPLRPLFPKGFRNDVQIIATALSSDKENQIDILAMNGAAAALALSGIPVTAMCASMRVAYLNGEFVVYPTQSQSNLAELDLIVSCTRDAIMMIEASASEVEESLILKGVEVAWVECQKLIDLIESLAAQARPEPIQRDFTMFRLGEDVLEAARAETVEGFRQALTVEGKQKQREALKTVRERARAALEERFPERLAELTDAVEDVLRDEVRRQILEDSRRPDGRSPRTIRPLRAEVSISPSTHGTGLFERGETQVLCTATLGTPGEMQRLDGLYDQESKAFMHQYNMPPFATGEAYPLRGPNRRAIGHGALAERSLKYVLPENGEFPYTIRLVSEVLESNGSTSMASVCAASLAMMDAGIPIRASVGGIAMGIVYASPEKCVVLTDIQGLEDHTGDMDFKVAGTRAGLTGLQLDVKMVALTLPILTNALEQAREARMQILDVMDACIAEPRPQLSPFAPRIEVLEVPVEKIGVVIGPGGKMIRKIEELGVDVDVEDDGRVYVTSSDSEASAKAVAMIRGLTHDPQPGEVYDARVVRFMPFGAFCEILPGRDGLLHVSQYSWERVESLEDVLKMGDIVRVQVSEIDDLGRINLSRKTLLERPASTPASATRDGDWKRRSDSRSPGGPPRSSSGRGGGSGGGMRPRFRPKR